MPAGKSSQSNAMLYTLIVFVGLFLVAAVAAFIFYLKAEEHKAANMSMATDMAKLAGKTENPEKIVGKRLEAETGRGEISYLGTMNKHLNEMISIITGKVPDDTPASVKINEVRFEINTIIKELSASNPAFYGSDKISLLQTIQGIKSQLEDARQKAREMENNLLAIQDEYDMAAQSFAEENGKLLEDKSLIQSLYDQLDSQYQQLKELTLQSADQQIQAYMDKLENAEQKIEIKNIELAHLQDELAQAKQALQDAIKKLEVIGRTGPDVEIMAFKPDARIIEIDRQTNVVYLDVGSDDHVYAGLTFAVYDKNEPVPTDGRGKAEIEVFDVTKTISAARIVRDSKKNPIVAEDIVANLIWDSKTSNSFVVAGDFDFDGDGYPDRDGVEKNSRLIEYWGGTITDQVTIKTDFLLLGIGPKELPEPTRTEIDIDPAVEERYQESVERANRYDAVISQAQTFNTPIINQKKFLYLIGYESLASKSSPQ